MRSPIVVSARMAVLLAAVTLIPTAALVPADGWNRCWEQAVTLAGWTPSESSLEEASADFHPPSISFSGEGAGGDTISHRGSSAYPTDGPRSKLELEATGNRPSNPRLRQVALSPRAAEEEFFRMQQELESLGVDYMRLGRSDIGNGSPQYHFLARLPIADASVYGRPFEATAGDPQAAVRQVLDQLRSRQAAKPPSR